MFETLRRSIGMSPSSSMHSGLSGSDGAPSNVLSPSNKSNTFIPLRRSNSFTNFFSASRPSSPTQEQQSSTAISSSPKSSPAKASMTATNDSATTSDAAAASGSDPVLAYLILLDKKGRQKEKYPIQSLKTTMGRSMDNDVRFLVSDVSRHHCTIEIEIDQTKNKAFLVVLGANGVLLNNVQALPATKAAGRYELRSGDSIVIAKRSFVLELLDQKEGSSEPQIFSSPVKGRTAGSQPPGSEKRRRVRMSLVNVAQINTPARPAASTRDATRLRSPSKSPAKENQVRDSRRASGLDKFMQQAKMDPVIKNRSGRLSLTSSTSSSNPFATPTKKSYGSTTEPKTAPAKQVTFSLFSNPYARPLSPVKQMKMMPPLDTMNEEQDTSLHSDDCEISTSDVPLEATLDVSDEPQQPVVEEHPSSEDIVIIEELENAQPESIEDKIQDREVESEQQQDKENIPSTSAAADAIPASPPASPSSASPKRPKRRSSFFGRAAPFKGISLGFYAEERTQEPDLPVVNQSPTASAVEEVQSQVGEVYEDASDVEMEEESPAPLAPQLDTPPARKPPMLGLSKTPSPVKKQHFVGLTPLPRRPRLSLTTKRRVSLRTQTLLRTSEAYSDRLFIPPPPPSPLSQSSMGMTKSMSMPSNLANLSSIPPPSAFSQQVEEAQGALQDGSSEQIAHLAGFDESQLDPELEGEKGEEGSPAAWVDAGGDDEDEVDQSLSVIVPTAGAKPYPFSPVKTAALPKFATPQPASRTHARRPSLPLAGNPSKTSRKSALIRLQISGAGERVVVATASGIGKTESSSPTKEKKLIRVSDVGLPSTDVSMGYDVVQDAEAQKEGEGIAEALNDLFDEEENEATDDESDEEEEEEVQDEVRMISSPVRQPQPQQLPLPPQTPAALNSLRHLFSNSSIQPSTPDMQDLSTLLRTPASEKAAYGTLGDRIRANPEIASLITSERPTPSSPSTPQPSPSKSRRGVRRSQAAEMPAAVNSIPSTVPLAMEAELHVTLIDTAAADAENEALALAQSVAPVEEEASPLPAFTAAAQQEWQQAPTEDIEARVAEESTNSEVAHLTAEATALEPAQDVFSMEGIAEEAVPEEAIAQASPVKVTESPTKGSRKERQSEAEDLAAGASPVSVQETEEALEKHPATPKSPAKKKVSPTKKSKTSADNAIGVPVITSAAEPNTETEIGGSDAHNVVNDQLEKEAVLQMRSDTCSQEVEEIAASSPTKARRATIRSSPVKRSPVKRGKDWARVSAETESAVQLEPQPTSPVKAAISNAEAATDTLEKDTEVAREVLETGEAEPATSGIEGEVGATTREQEATASPSKSKKQPTRGRKAKQAAVEAISALSSDPVVLTDAASSPTKRSARLVSAAAATNEEVQIGELQQHQEPDAHIQSQIVEQDVEDSEPKSTVRSKTAAGAVKGTRAVRSKKALATSTNLPLDDPVVVDQEASITAEAEMSVKPVRRTRAAAAAASTTTAVVVMPKKTTSRSTRTKSSSGSAVIAPSSDIPDIPPSSSAGYGDDEASDMDSIPVVKATTSRKKASSNTAAKSTKPTSSTTATTTSTTARGRKPKPAAIIPSSELDLVIPEEEESVAREDEAEVKPKPRSTRSKQQPTPTSTTSGTGARKSRKDTEEGAVDFSSTTATTRSGRPKRAVVAAASN